MRHWLQLGIRNWRAKPGRTLGAAGAVAIGVGVVIWVTCAYESVRLALSDQVWFWIGRSHLSVESVYGPQGTVYQSIADDARRLDNVLHVTYRLKYPMVLETKPAPLSRPGAASQPGQEPLGVAVTVQAIGIEPALERPFRTFERERIAGRMLEPGDTGAAVVDRRLAEQLHLRIGDTFTLHCDRPDPDRKPSRDIMTFTVVGLMEYHRIARQQRPVVLVPLAALQSLAGYDHRPRRVTRIDLMLKDASQKALILAERRLTRRIAHYRQPFIVTSAHSKLVQVKAAERQTKFILLLISTVALFTAFFIILSTLSMGMVERVAQLGTLRCLGGTRRQLAVLVLGEASLLGLAGIVAGIPLGLALGKLSVRLAPEYIGTFAISRSGMVLAVVGGAVTTLAGALVPMIQAFRVSPLAASRPQASPPPSALVWVAGVLGAAMVGGHVWMLTHVPPNKLYQSHTAILAVALLYVGYAFLVPALIRLFSVLAVRVAAVALRLRYPLLRDQVGRTVWRSAAICCGLMVGLSMIVTLFVHSESLAAGWNFPRDFCEAFLYVSPAVPKQTADAARRLPGIAESCLVNTNIRCTIYGKGLFHFPFSLFIAGDPNEFFKIARLTFLEGTQEEAVAKLARGGAIIVTPEFVRSKKCGYGDKVVIKQATLFGRASRFEIAAVVTSPALDIAANYFNAGDMLMSQSVHVALGTFADARRVFRVPEEVTLFLFNFDLPETPPPPEFRQDTPPPATPRALVEALRRWREALPERTAEVNRILSAAQVSIPPSLGPTGSPELRVFADALASLYPSWSALTPEQRWRSFREELVMRFLAHRAGVAWEQHGSVRALKMRIDRELRRATRLFAAIPMVALLVAALGVGNLMSANVASRSRQLATLRALGATRWQIARLIIGEALTLGLLGSGVGVALGLQAARSINYMVELLWGYRPIWAVPVDWMALGIGLTVVVCILAGIIPARRAARSNIIAALQTT